MLHFPDWWGVPVSPHVLPSQDGCFASRLLFPLLAPFHKPHRFCGVHRQACKTSKLRRDTLFFGKTESQETTRNQI